MSALVLSLLLKGALAMSVAILLVLMLRRPVRRRFGALNAYALWILPPLCLLIALLPPTAPAGLAPAIALVGEGAVAADRGAGGAFWRDALVSSWLGGALAFGCVFALRQHRFRAALGALSPWPYDGRVLIGARHRGGPLVLGLFRPRIVLPADFDLRFQGEARALVLAHERIHLERGDPAVNGLVVALQCLCWFNPLVHLAAYRLRIDQEIACDAAVLSSQPQLSRLYAETLIGAFDAPMPAPLACGWPAGGAQPLKERLLMMSNVSISKARRALGTCLVGALAAAGAGVVWAANPTPAEIITQPDWISRPTGADLKRFYPAEAEKTRTGGRATIECGVGVDGRLNACKVASESPAAAGFGEAALKLSQTFQMSPQSRDGKPTANGMVRIPIMFAVAPQPQP